MTERHAPYLLWVDSETTGLHHPTNTILELAWFVTDSDGEPLTPLRSRFTAIQPDDSPMIPAGNDQWNVAEGLDAVPSRFVRDMHDASGLTADHAAAQGEGGIIRCAPVAEQLMLDDLRHAWHTAPAQDHRTLSRLAGDGVAHFEDTQFTLNFPAVYGGPDAALHYRPVDVSGALEVMTRGRGDIGQVLAANPERAFQHVRTLTVGSWPTFGLRNHADDDIARSPKAWAAAYETPHRAAADIVRAWVVYRLIHDQGGIVVPYRSA